ncbi:MAG TPA: hypothetical protein VF043_07220 [Ktedonobacteraceae bacterium]
MPGTTRLIPMMRDRILRSCVTGNDHARFSIGDSRNNPVADSTRGGTTSTFW